MKKAIIILTSSFFLISTMQPIAWGSEPSLIRADSTYIGNFSGFKEDSIQIDLSRTGYRVSLPLDDDVEYLHKYNGSSTVDPDNIPLNARIKAIEVNRKIVQIILLMELPH